MLSLKILETTKKELNWLYLSDPIRVTIRVLFSFSFRLFHEFLHGTDIQHRPKYELNHFSVMSASLLYFPLVSIMSKRAPA